MATTAGGLERIRHWRNIGAATGIDVCLCQWKLVAVRAAIRLLRQRESFTERGHDVGARERFRVQRAFASSAGSFSIASRRGLKSSTTDTTASPLPSADQRSLICPIALPEPKRACPPPNDEGLNTRMLKAPVRVNFPSFTASRYSGASFSNVNVASSPASTLVPCSFTPPQGAPCRSQNPGMRSAPPGISTRQPIADSRESAPPRQVQPFVEAIDVLRAEELCKPQNEAVGQLPPSDGHTSSGAHCQRFEPALHLPSTNR